MMPNYSYNLHNLLGFFAVVKEPEHFPGENKEAQFFYIPSEHFRVCVPSCIVRYILPLLKAYLLFIHINENVLLKWSECPF